MKKIFLWLVPLCLVGNLVFAEGTNFINIATGTTSSVYFHIGGAICKMVHKKRQQYNTRCTASATSATIFNINDLQKGSSDLAIMQSDWQYYAYSGAYFFAKNKFSNLRTVLPLYDEFVSIVVRENSNIFTLEDLKSKKVNIGPPGSGIKAIFSILMEYKNWSNKDFSLIAELSPAEQGQALCDKKIDAAVFVIGHPNGLLHEIANSCNIRIIEINKNDTDIQRLTHERSFYKILPIRGGMYPGNPNDIQTLSVKTVLAASSTMDKNLIYEVTKAIIDNIDYFQTLHTVLNNLTLSGIMENELLVPLHDGSRRYLSEIKLIKNNEY